MIKGLGDKPTDSTDAFKIKGLRGCHLTFETGLTLFLYKT